jgi:hypothetical protein
LGADEVAAVVFPRRTSQEQRGRDFSQGFASTQLNKGVLYFKISKSCVCYEAKGYLYKEQTSRIGENTKQKTKRQPM